jgi:hypothetical protein
MLAAVYHGRAALLRWTGRLPRAVTVDGPAATWPAERRLADRHTRVLWSLG